MRPRRIVAAGLLLATSAFVYSPSPSNAAPTQEQLAPKLRQFVPAEASITQEGASQPIVIGAARTGEIAVGNVNLTEANELVIGGGNGIVYVSTNLASISTQFTPFTGYSGPLFVAVGNLDEDSPAEIVAATGTGANTRFRIFNGDGTPVGAEVVPYGASFAGGARVAIGNVTGDTVNEIVTVAGPGGGSHVKLYTPAGSAIGEGFIAFTPQFTGGAFPAVGNLDGDPADEILLGPGASTAGRLPVAHNGDATPVTLPTRNNPPADDQGDVRVAIGVVGGVASYAEAVRTGPESRVSTIPIAGGSLKSATPAESDGALSVAIAGGKVITLDTGPRLIAIDPNTLVDHTRNDVTLYGGGLDALGVPNVYIGTAPNVVGVEAERMGDNLTFSLPVPAFVGAGGLRVTLGEFDNPRQLHEDNMLTINRHNPPLDSLITTGVGRDGGPHVRMFSNDGALGGGFMSGPATIGGGVRVARGDLDGDGVDEVVTTTGPGTTPVVRVFSRSGSLIRQFSAYPDSFLGGLFVSVGDIDGDENLDIFTAPDAGGGPHVKVFSGTGEAKSQFMAYEPTFTGGVRLAAADIDGDQKDEIVTAPGPGGGPHIKATNGIGVIAIQFMAYAPNFTGGVFVAGADTTGTAVDDIVTGPGAGGGPHVRAFANGQERFGFMAFASNFTGGVSVGRVGDDFIGPNLVAVGAGPGGGPHVKLFDKTREVTGFYAYDPTFVGGVFVAGGIAP